MPYLVDDLQAYDYENLTVADSSVGFDLAKVFSVPGCRGIEFFVDTAQIRYRKDGSAPTSSVGAILNPFSSLKLENPSEIENFRAIRTGTISANLRVHFRR